MSQFTRSAPPLPGANPAPTARMAGGSSPNDTPAGIKLPLTDNFTIFLQHGETWATETNEAVCYGEVLYESVCKFSDLLDHVRSTARIEAHHPMVLEVAYKVTREELQVFLQLDNDMDEQGIKKRGKPKKRKRGIAQNDGDITWRQVFVQDQKGWDAVVFSAQQATAKGKTFPGIHLRVCRPKQPDFDYKYRVLRVGEESPTEGGLITDDDTSGLHCDSDEEERERKALRSAPIRRRSGMV